MLKTGTIFEQKYEILKLIGEGGTSKVYLAMNLKLNQPWVIKEIDNCGNSQDAKNVLKEARLMMRFDHPAIPRIVDIIEKRYATYIIMDYVSGQSLAHALKEKGPMPQESVTEWGKQICNVLIYLHSLTPPIIYHDLKPGNLILKEPEKNIKLIDFGEARPCINGNAPGAGKTKEYAAPEQQSLFRGKTDQRTDLYCLGTTMYRLLTGEFPPMAPQTVGSVREAFPERNISKGMSNIIEKCTRTNPEERFQNAEELMRAFSNMELWDEDYLKQLKTKVRRVLFVFLLGVGFFAAGLGFYQAAVFVQAKDYEHLLGISKAADYEEQIASYRKAIEIDGDNPRAYIALLNAFESQGQFGIAESQKFSSLYNRNRDYFRENSTAVLEMHYLAGRLYFNMYDDSSASIRSRILKAHDFFSYVCEWGTAEYENYEMAAAYECLCEFFETFVLNHSSIREPSKEEYRRMIDALPNCLNDMKQYSAGDAAYTRLTLYGYLLDMLNVNMRGIAVNEIEIDLVEKILEQIQTAVESEIVTREKSLEKRSQILESIENVSENMRREYESLK